MKGVTVNLLRIIKLSLFLMIVCSIIISCGYSRQEYQSAKKNAYNSGRNEGFNEGYEKGYGEGIEAGAEKGLMDGYNIGYNDANTKKPKVVPGIERYRNFYLFKNKKTLYVFKIISYILLILSCLLTIFNLIFSEDQNNFKLSKIITTIIAVLFGILVRVSIDLSIVEILQMELDRVSSMLKSAIIGGSFTLLICLLFNFLLRRFPKVYKIFIEIIIIFGIVLVIPNLIFLLIDDLRIYDFTIKGISAITIGSCFGVLFYILIESIRQGMTGKKNFKWIVSSKSQN